jgi:hypothetical protein
MQDAVRQSRATVPHVFHKMVLIECFAHHLKNKNKILALGAAGCARAWDSGGTHGYIIPILSSNLPALRCHDEARAERAATKARPQYRACNIPMS